MTVPVERLTTIVCDNCSGELFEVVLRVLDRQGAAIAGGPNELTVQMMRCVACHRVFPPPAMPREAQGGVPRVCGCGGDLWREVCMLKQMPSVLSPSGRVETVALPVRVCVACGVRMGGEKKNNDGGPCR